MDWGGPKVTSNVNFARQRDVPLTCRLGNERGGGPSSQMKVYVHRQGVALRWSQEGESVWSFTDIQILFVFLRHMTLGG